MMVKWIAKIHWGKVLLLGFLFTIISVVVRQVEMSLTMGYYTDPRYFGVWSRLMMPVAGPPPAEFFIISTIATFFTGIAITIIYYYLKEYLPKGYYHRSFFFADLLVATSFVFFTLPTLLLFNVPWSLVAIWFVSSFITIVVNSLLVVKVVGK